LGQRSGRSQQGAMLAQSIEVPERMRERMTATVLRRYGFLWVTLVLFVGSLIGHWVFAWFAYVDQQHSLGQAVQVSAYVIETLRDTFENWQSEFLQLIWQVAGLAIFLYVGSPQSREGDERKEEKINAILHYVAGQDGDRIIRELDEKFAHKNP
jgi:hypothetical protein